MAEDPTIETSDAGQTQESDTQDAAQQAPKGDTPPVVEDSAPADDWRSRMAGGDEAARKRFDRYKTEADVGKALIEAQTRISKGLEPLKLGENATEEEISAYRKAMGVPEKAESYLDNLDGIVIGEDDKEVVGKFLERVHGKNASPEFVSEALKWYTETAEAQAATIVEFDKQSEKAREDTLRDVWGAEYRGNMNALENLLATAPAMADGNPLSEALRTARLGDGTLLWNNPDALQWLMGLQKEINPAAGVMPSGVTDGASIDAEINKIETVMRESRAVYNKDAKMQERYASLLTAREKHK